MLQQFKIEKVEVDHFRGFRDQLVFDLSEGANLTILTGSNGFGKTSFFDAIEWTFTGRLFRYEEADEEKRQTVFISHLAHDQQGVECPAQVRVTMSDGQDSYQITRLIREINGDSDYGEHKTQLFLTGPTGSFEDKAALEQLDCLLINEHWQGKLHFQDIFNHYHFLTQDRLDNFVRGSKGPERYNQISQLFGNQRYVKYGEIFQDILAKEEKRHSALADEIAMLKSKVNNLEKLIKAEDVINLGNYATVREYVESLFTEIKELAITFNLKPELEVSFNNCLMASRSKDQDEVQLLTKAKTTILQLLEAVRGQEQEILRRLVALRQLEGESEEYWQNLNSINILEEEISRGKMVRDLLEIRENLPWYANYQDKIAQLEKEKQQALEEYGIKSRAVEEKRNIISGLTRLQAKLSSFLAPLCSEFLSINNAHTYQAKELWSYLHTLTEHQTLFPTLSNRDNVIGGMTRRITELERLESLRNSYLSEADGLKKEIDGLAHEEKELDQILTSALEYLNAHARAEADHTTCPVCGTDYPLAQLTETITRRMASENNLLKIKSEKRTSLFDSIAALDLKLKMELENILNLVKSVENLITDFGRTVDTELDRLWEEQDKLQIATQSMEEALKNLKVQQDSLIQLITRLNLPLDSNELEEQIGALLQEYASKLGTQTDVARMEQERALLMEKIKNYQGNLMALGMVLEEISALPTKVIEESNRVMALTNLHNKAKFVEIRLLEMEKSLANSKHRANLQESLTLLATKQKELVHIEGAIQKLVALKSGAKKLIEEMNQRTLAELADLINKLFSRIYPHPFYRNLRLKLDYNSRGNNILTFECQDEKGGNFINPIWTFSTAQVNVIAVSVFLAMAMQQQCTRLATILMDDPIQSMDDINILSFIDILRSCSDERHTDAEQLGHKQIILSTHDDKIHRLMMNKFRFLSAKSITLTEYTERGPRQECR